MITARLTFEDRGRRRIPATLSYDPADPLVVALVLIPHGRPHPPWYLSRALLADAMVCPEVGEGDVRVRVTRDGWMWLRLSSPDGVLELRCSAPTVWEHLMATFRAAPTCRGKGPPGHQWCGECPVVEVALERWLAGVREPRS